MARNREFDAIVFGASGFTGQFVVEEMATSMEMDSLYKHDNLRWAVAGRNKAKIEDTLKQAAANTGIDWIPRVPIIPADVENYESLLALCKRTRLIITVVGPYRFFGEPMVRACIEAATDYVDISGEPQFIEGMQLKYYEDAKRKGVYIVSAAGWDSVPADVGTTWTKQIFKGDLNGVEIIVDTKAPDGTKLNFGTWHSAIYGYAHASELVPLRRKLFSQVLIPPTSRSIYPMRRRRLMSYCDEVKGYLLPFPGSDRTVVKRSEVLKYHTKKERPVMCETYFRVPTVSSGIVMIMAAILFGIMAKFSFGRYLLKKYPKFFSAGACSSDGVPRENLARSSSSHIIIGQGWDDRLDDIDRQHDKPPSKKIVTKISGPDPGYTMTSALVVHSGMTLLFDREKLPAPGVLTPGACFRDTHLIDRLTKRNIKFDILPL